MLVQVQHILDDADVLNHGEASSNREDVAEIFRCVALFVGASLAVLGGFAVLRRILRAISLSFGLLGSAILATTLRTANPSFARLCLFGRSSLVKSGVRMC